MPRHFCTAEIFDGIDFCQCGKGRHILYVIINLTQDKNFANESRWRIGKYFLLVKLSVYTV